MRIAYTGGMNYVFNSSIRKEEKLSTYLNLKLKLILKKCWIVRYENNAVYSRNLSPEIHNATKDLSA